MPPGFGDGKPPPTSHQELPEDPIETESEAGLKGTIKTNQLFTTSTHSRRPKKPIPSSFESYASDGAEEIPLPFPKFDMGMPNTRTHDILSGHTQPVSRLYTTKTYKTHANISQNRKRNRDQTELEKPRAENARQFKQTKIMEQPSFISGDDEDHVQQPPRFAGGFKRQSAQNVKAGSVSNRMDVSPDDTDEIRSPHFTLQRHQFLNNHLQVVIPKEGNSHSNGNEWSGIGSRWSTRPRGRGRGGHLISARRNNKKKNKSPEDKPLRLEASEEGEHFKIFLGDEECEGAGFNSDKLFGNILSCEEEHSFGFTLRTHSAQQKNGYFVLKDPSDIAAVYKIFPTRLNIKTIEPDRMRNHCITLKECASRGGDVSLVVDPEATKGLELQQDYDIAMRTREEEGRKSSRVKSNQTKPLAEPPSTRITRSRKTVPVGTSCSISVDDSDHRVACSEEIPKPELPPPWKQPLLYPFEGSKRANVDYEDLIRLSPTEFLNDNIINFYLRHIEENLRHKNPLLHQETHFFNTFFYERLSMKGKGDKDKQRNMDQVLKWTAKIDLFKKNYVIVPINESSHWYLAIICNLQHLERKLQKYPAVDSDATITSDTDQIDNSSSPVPSIHQQPVLNPDTHPDEMEIVSENNHNISETQNGLESMSVNEDEWPEPDENESRDRILEDRNKQIKLGTGSNDTIDIEMVDSKSPSRNTLAKAKPPRKSSHFQSPDDPAIIILDSMGIKRTTTIAKLKDWLILEARELRSLEIPKDTLKGTHPKAPIQDNWHDCGLYMLHYIEIFLEHREELIASFLARDNTIEPMIWRDNDIKGMRTRLFNLICKLQKEYDALHPVKATSKAKVVAQPPAKAKASPGSVDDDTSSKMPSPQRRIESPGTQIILEANSAARTAEPATETAMDYQLDNEEAVHERELSHLEQKENHHTKNGHSSLKAKPRTEKRHRVEVEVTGTDDKDDEDSVDVIEMVVSEPKLEPGVSRRVRQNL